VNTRALPAPPSLGQSVKRLLPPLALLTLWWLATWVARTQAAWPLDGAAPDTTSRLLNTAAWAAGLWLMLRLLEVLVWERLVPRHAGVRIPRLLRQVVALLLFGIGMGVILSRLWEVSVLPVLATTGAIGIVAGLALRNLLADFFSGIALNLEHPFRLDDFVLLHVRGKRDPVAGFVREINWRSTTVLTPEDNLISVPNSVLAMCTVENLSFPSPVYELELDIVLDWALNPAVLDAVLGAAMVDAWVRGATSGDRPPKFRISRLDGTGVTYKIVYLIDPRKKPKGPARHTLLSCLHTHLRLAGLRPVSAAEPGAAAPPPQRACDHAVDEDRQALLAQIRLLEVLSARERQALAAGVQVLHRPAGSTVVRAGEAGDSMFIVAAGVLEVLRPGAQGVAAVRHNILSPGDFFGEMSLLTGAPRAATVASLCPVVLYEVPHALLATLLTRRPALAEVLAQVVADHQRRDAAAMAGSAVPGPGPSPTLAEQIAAHVRRLFGL
jgi:small-conductance mechanosensitive channel/CRP-like cAMP-binding protein